MATSKPGNSGCFIPAIENGYVSQQKGPYQKDSVLSVVCHSGYSQNGSPTITCNGNTWEGSPKCSLEFIHDG